MRTTNRNNQGAEDLTADALMGRQSVRVTFRLPEGAIALLGMAANHLGLQQKSLFDQLVEDRDILEKIAEACRCSAVAEGEKVQKTYVISKSSLLALRKIAKENRISRDLLVESAINRLRPVITAEQERQKKWKFLLERMEDLLHQGQSTVEAAAELLAPEDQVRQKIERMMGDLQKGCSDIQGWIRKGRRMEEFKEPRG